MLCPTAIISLHSPAIVIPTKVGNQFLFTVILHEVAGSSLKSFWVPFFNGMTMFDVSRPLSSSQLPYRHPDESRDPDPPPSSRRKSGTRSPSVIPTKVGNQIPLPSSRRKSGPSFKSFWVPFFNGMTMFDVSRPLSLSRTLSLPSSRRKSGPSFPYSSSRRKSGPSFKTFWVPFFNGMTSV
jgi:hypothetical protein